MNMRMLRRLLAAALALVLAMCCACAEEQSAPVEPTIVEELGEFDLPVEVAAPEADPAAPEADPAAPEADPVAPEADPAAPEADPAAPEEPDPALLDPDAYAVAAPADFISAVTLGVKERFALNGAEAFGQPVAYVSQKPKIAAVDANGVVTANRRGTAVIDCYVGEALVGSCSVTVLKAPKKVTLPQKSIVISKDQLLAFAAALPKGCAGAISYATDNPAVLAVDAMGNLYGLSGGSATLTATAYNGKFAQCSVRVLGGPAPTWLQLSASALSIPVRTTAQLTAGFDAGCDAILTYATSNKKIATVSETGLVTAKKAGTATITVTTHNGLSAACTVSVYNAPSKVTLNVNKLTMRVNDGYQLQATLPAKSWSEIAWSTDNGGVATVDASGMVVAVNVGQATITAVTTNGKRASCKVTVQDESGSVGRGTLVYEEQTENLHLKIVNDGGVILSYIWAKDLNNQLYKVYGGGKPIDIMNNAVNANGLTNRLLLAFNASAPVSSTYGKRWYKDPIYRNREPSPLMIANGEVLVNDPTTINRLLYYYWLDGNNELCYTPKTMDQYTVEERAELYQQIIDSGARNTAIWRPVLISNYQATTLTKAFLTMTAGKKRKQALCQIDNHNFILVTASGKGMMDYPHFQKYLMGLGVKTAVEFDAGGSATTMYKPSASPTMKKLVGGGRTLTMMMYILG